jgi:hypothetical protein
VSVSQKIDMTGRGTEVVGSGPCGTREVLPGRQAVNEAERIEGP